MTENSLVIQNYRVSNEELLKWFGEHVGEVARCLRCAEPADAVLLELVLENEIERALDRFTMYFPAACARRAQPADYASLVEHCTGELHMKLGGVMDVTLRLSPSTGGGTGSKLWSGGLLLAEWLMAHAETGDISTIPCISDCSVLELGAGAAALPSIAASQCGAQKVVASDCIGSVVEQMAQNMHRNAPVVESRFLDWTVAGRQSFAPEEQFDLILFSDAIYNPRGAFFLACAISALLRPGGSIIGALPDTRNGIQSFEEDLAASGYIATPLIVDSTLLHAASQPVLNNDAGLIAAEDLTAYRLVMWS